jgi:hypothetical protein
MRYIDEPVVCTQHFPDTWHDKNTEAQAIRLCTTGGPDGGPCPALAECLDISTDPSNLTFTKYGVWGGVDERRRDRIRARRLRGEEPRYQNVTFTTTNRRTPVQQSSL